jgi:hypothetical protein
MLTSSSAPGKGTKSGSSTVTSRACDARWSVALTSVESRSIAKLTMNSSNAAREPYGKRGIRLRQRLLVAPLLGYPADVEFVPADEEWADEVVWHNLIVGQATVLVSEELELLLTPLRRGPLDRLRGVVPVNVAHHVQGHAAPYATHSRLGRHPVCQMRQLAHAA